MMLASAFSFLDWSTNYGRYHTLFHCMDQDMFWIGATVTLDVAVATGYALIALHWWRNERHLPPVPAKRALRNIRNIFVFCGICGYLFIPVKMYWPAWRLYDFFMLALAYSTWKYAWGAKDLKVIYNEVGRTRKLAEDLAKSQEESKRKTFFLNAISHDLRTPLNGLMLQANLAEIGLSAADKETVRDAVAEIKNTVRATADLLESFLEYARLDWANEDNSISKVEVPVLLGDIIRIALPSTEEKGIYLRGHCPAHLTIDTDRAKLERVLSNLVTNAIKFTDHGGVRVEVERCPSAIQIHVVDSGIGIDADDQERLFEEFVQLGNGERDRRKGFGLGLAIARRLATQLGGDIAVVSAVGKGSRFTLTLPAQIDRAKFEPRPSGAAAATASV